MKYQEINGKKVSQITLGTVQLGMNYGIVNTKGQPSRQQSYEILSAAFNNGITSIDTASGYGNSEEIIGTYFKEFQCKLPFITTKYKSKLADGAFYNEIESEIFNSVENSLLRLNVDKIDCLMLHNAKDMTRHGKSVEKVIEKLIVKGLVDMAGVSVYTTDEIDIMLKNDLYKTIQLPISIFDRQLIERGYIDKLAQKNIHIFVRSVFLQGLFFINPDNNTDADIEKYASKYIRLLSVFAKKENMSIAELAISYIRDISGTTSLVLGADNKEQVIENINYINAPAISKDTKILIEKKLVDINIMEIMKILSKPKNNN